MKRHPPLAPTKVCEQKLPIIRTILRFTDTLDLQLAFAVTKQHHFGI